MESQKGDIKERSAEQSVEERKQRVRDMFMRLRKYRGALPAGFKFNREEAHERR